ncbi:MAG: hypothetical protein AAGA85_25155, partial [Bacteroidota bacterium]
VGVVNRARDRNLSVAQGTHRQIPDSPLHFRPRNANAVRRSRMTAEVWSMKEGKKALNSSTPSILQLLNPPQAQKLFNFLNLSTFQLKLTPA